MEPLERFIAYATAFEETVRSDDWTGLEAFFTDDALYEVTGSPIFAARHQGREAVFAGLKASLDAIDRRFETRELEMLKGPELRDGAVRFKWRAAYRSPGVPELVFEGLETVVFEGDRIRHLVDEIPLEMGGITEHWLNHYETLLPRSPA